jgi:hypothetical protein
MYRTILYDGTMTTFPGKKSNRDTERHYFERFRKSYALPLGEISYADKPDVLVKGTQTIGIEITNFYHEPGNDEGSEQRQRPRRYDVASEAHSLYRAAGGRGIELTIEFSSTNPITSVTRRTLPQKIATFAASVEDQSSGPFYADSFPDMPEITSIWLNSKDWPDAKWVRPGQVYSYEEMSTARLQTIVAEKESKAAHYTSCDAYWLLIIVDWIDSAQDQEITTTGVKLSSDVFEKIIIYKPGFEDIVDVSR